MDEFIDAIWWTPKQLGAAFICIAAYSTFASQLLVGPIIAASVEDEWLDIDIHDYNKVFVFTGLARLLSCIFLAPLQDYIGRRICLVYSATLLLLFVFLHLVSRSFVSYIAYRFFAVLFSDGLCCYGYAYGFEMIPKRKHVLLGSLSQMSSATWDAISLAIQWKVEMDWRYLNLIIAAPAIALLLVALLVWTESPAYEATQGREIRSQIMLQRLVPKSKRLVNVEEEQKEQGCPFKNSSLRKFCPDIKFKFKNMKKLATIRTSLLAGLWLIQAFAYWGVSSYLPTFLSYMNLQANLTQILCYICQLPGHLLIGHLMKRLGSLTAARIFAICGATLLLLLAILSVATPNSHLVQTIISVLMYVFLGPLYNFLYSYSTFSYPTEIRGSALALFGIVSATAIMITSVVGSVTLQEESIWIFPLILGLCYVLFAFITIFITDY